MKFQKTTKKKKFSKTMFTAKNLKGKILDASERGPRTILVDLESF